MGVINKYQRRKVLDRQKLLYNLHCRGCPVNNKKTSTKWCDGCAIYGELKGLGKVLDRTVRERAIWEYDDEEVS